jgi:hypothetical protein
VKTKLMSKTFMGILIGVMLLGTLLFQVVHISAQTNGNLDHVSMNPLTASLAAGATQQYSAQGYDANNVAIPNLPYTWTVIAGGGSVNTSGLFTAGAAAGTYTNSIEVIAFQGNTAQAAFASVSVLGTVGPLDHVQLTPVSVNLIAAGTQQFAAQAYDSNNVAIPGLTYNWSVVGGGGTVSTAGLFTAGAVVSTYTNTIQVQAIQGGNNRVVFASVTVSAYLGNLDHVEITPSHVNVAVGATQQFSAQAYDSNNVAIAGLTYNWSVVAGGGAVSQTGLFTSGNVSGSFANTVQVQATQGTNNRVAFASVNVTNGSTSASALSSKKLVSPLGASLRSVGFDNLLSAQLVVKQGTTNVTVNVIPGQVTAVTATALTITPNGQTASVSYVLPSASVVQPSGSQLAVNDKVVVVTLNDQVGLVYKVTAPAAPKTLPPGLEKKDNSAGANQVIPPGWAKGNKTGWNNNQSNKSNNSSKNDK